MNTKTHILEQAKQHIENGEIRRKHLTQVAEALGYTPDQYGDMFTGSARAETKGRYIYDTLVAEASGTTSVTPVASSPTGNSQYKNVTVLMDGVPSVNPNYIKWGNYNKVSKIIDSGEFIPTLVTGLSGNGKTLMVEQICAKISFRCFKQLSIQS